jgi:hypothetical protein
LPVHSNPALKPNFKRKDLKKKYRNSNYEHDIKHYSDLKSAAGLNSLKLTPGPLLSMNKAPAKNYSLNNDFFIPSSSIPELLVYRRRRFQTS